MTIGGSGSRGQKSFDSYIMSHIVFSGFVLLVPKYQALTCSDSVSATLSDLGGGVELQRVPCLVASAEPLTKPCCSTRFMW